MPSNKSQANSSSTPIEVTIREAVEEFRIIMKALSEQIKHCVTVEVAECGLDADEYLIALSESLPNK